MWLLCLPTFTIKFKPNVDKYSIQWSICALEKGGFRSFLIDSKPVFPGFWGLPSWKPARDPRFVGPNAFSVTATLSLKGAQSPPQRRGSRESMSSRDYVGAKLRDASNFFRKKKGKNIQKLRSTSRTTSDNFFYYHLRCSRARFAVDSYYKW